MATPDSRLATSGQTLKDDGYGLFAGETAADAARIATSLVQRIECPSFTDAATAGTAVTESPLVNFPAAMFPNGVKIVAATFTTPIAVMASDTTFATVTLASRNAAGGGSTTIGSQTTKITGGTGNITAFVAQPLTLTAANVIVPAGGSITLAVAKASTGVALTAATSTCSLTIWLEEL